MVKNKASALVSQSIINLIFIIFSAMCIIPMLLIASISFSNENSIYEFGYKLFPPKIDFLAYEFIFKNPAQILNSYGVSFTVTICGTLISLFLCSLTAYALSRSDFDYKNQVTFYMWFPTIFGGGMVPWYILINKYLGMKDTIWVLIIPLLISPWNILLLRTFFKKIPQEILESSKLDGANEFFIYFRIILPLSKPALATIGLFISMMYWNDWWLSLLFIENEKLVPLQYMLHRIMSNIAALQMQMKILPFAVDQNLKLPDESARMAMCILAAGPMLFVFQFFQKYFVKGLTVGAVKG